LKDPQGSSKIRAEFQTSHPELQSSAQMLKDLRRSSDFVSLTFREQHSSDAFVIEFEGPITYLGFSK
jgi:hypothetical protein